MSNNCVPLVVDLKLFCYDSDFMLSLSEDTKSEVMEAFNSTCRYPNIDNNFIDSMDYHTNHPVKQDTEASFSDLYTYLYQMVLLRLKFMINDLTLILIL